jgi:hypothetical protein
MAEDRPQIALPTAMGFGAKERIARSVLGLQAGRAILWRRKSHGLRGLPGGAEGIRIEDHS